MEDMSDRLVKGIKEAEKELEKQKLKKQEEEVHVQYVCNTLFAAYMYVYIHMHTTILQYILYIHPMLNCVVCVLYVKLHYIL